MPRKREANIEIMRIILFLMVVCLHVVAPYRQSRFDKFEFNWQFSAALASLSRVCTNCFVLISGYFYASGRSRRASSSVVKLLVPVLVYLPFYLFLEFNLDFAQALERVFMATLKNEYNMYHLWFVQVFFIITLLSPFLANALEHAERHAHRTVMVTLLAVCSFMPTFTYLTGLYWFDSALFDSKLVLFLALYVIGAYIKKYPPRISALTAGLMFAGTQVLIALGNVWYNTRYSPVNLIQRLTGSMASLSEGAWIETTGLSGALSDPRNALIIAASVLMLIFFSKLRINSPRAVKLAGHVYGAYIIHVFWIQIISRVRDTYYDLYSNIWLDSEDFPLYILCFITVVAVCSLLTDIVLNGAYRLAVKYAYSRARD